MNNFRYDSESRFFRSYNKSLRTVNHAWIRQAETAVSGEIYHSILSTGDVVVLLAGQWTCNLQVAGSTRGWEPLHSGLGQKLSLGRESNREPGGK